MSLWTYADRFGIELDAEMIQTKIGLQIKPGESYRFYCTQKIYKNFTCTEEGFEGEEVTKGQSTVSPMYKNILNNEVEVVYNFPSDCEFDDGIDYYRVAGIVHTATGSGAPYISLLCRDSNNSVYGDPMVYRNGSRQNFFGLQIPEAMFSCNNLGDASSPYTTNATFVSAIQGVSNNYYSRLNNANYFQKLTFATNIPIFDTEAHAKAYLEDFTNETIEGIVNPSTLDPVEEYKKDQLYYYLHNIFEQQLSGGRVHKYYRNYRWKPGYDSKIRMYKVNPTKTSPYNWVLVVPGGMTRYVGPKGDYSSWDVYEEDNSGTYLNHYLSESLLFERTGPEKNIWEVSDFDTNIPRFIDAQTATDYANDIVGIEAAINYTDILRQQQEILGPDYGDADAETETGVNGQSYFGGSCIYAMTRTQMLQFFTEIFKVQDPAFINAFKEGNVLFGDNQVNAIIGCLYFPFDVTDVCSLESVAGDIWVGGWKTTVAKGKKVQFNDKLLEIGSFQMTDMFQDVRDYSPYTNLYVQLPYCGTYELAIEKYLGKLVTIKYAVDIFSGACLAMIFANGILLDTMDGMMGSQRPVTGRTAGNIMSSISSAVTGAGGAAVGAAKGTSLALGAGNAIASGGLGAAGGALGISAGTGTATLGAAVGIGGTALAGAGAVAGGFAVGTFAAYNIKNAYADPPMQSRGAYGGNLGMFGVQKVHFIVAIRHHERPENELDLIGYPSGRSGKISSFSGFLKSSMVYLADGFIGSRQERDEILEMISKGIYI